MEQFIQLKKDNILRIGIKTSDGIDTGEHLEFDLEDIELPLRLNECNELHKQNLKDLRAKYMLIDKKQDRKGKKILSTNEEAKIIALNEFYKKESLALDMFLGENGTYKMLNGRKPYYSMFDEFMEALEPILPLIKNNADNIKDKIMKKYSTKEDDILE